VEATGRESGRDFQRPASAYGAAGIHWGNVNPGMAVGAAGDVNCGSQGGWCYEAYTSGHAAWQKSMQLWLR
jgi:hypothetical protein